jgi:hypothetical protein
MKLPSADGRVIIIVFHSNCDFIHIEHPLSILSVFLFVIYSWNVGNGEPSPTQEWQYACQYENRRNGTVAFRDVFGRTQAAGSGSPDSISAVLVKGVSIEHRKMKEKRTSGNGTA